jgi:DNA-binding CsgD family transcriptional regulator
MMLSIRITAFIKDKIHYRHPDTYDEELNCQCKLLMLPASFSALLGWLPFIPYDIGLYRRLPSIPYFRMGLTVVGVIMIIFHFVPLERLHPYFVRKKSYLLYLLLIGYLELATGVVVGMVGADPVYMGGYSIVVLLLTFNPIKTKHALALLGLSLLLFFVVGIFSGLNFRSDYNRYGLVNLIEAIWVTLLFLGIMGYVRKSHYHKSLVLQKKNDETLSVFFRQKGISKREEEIIHLVLQGMSNNEIEKKLFISLKTVKNHVYNVYRKLGVKSRVQLLNLIRDTRKKL